MNDKPISPDELQRILDLARSQNASVKIEYKQLKDGSYIAVKAKIITVEKDRKKNGR